MTSRVLRAAALAAALSALSAASFAEEPASCPPVDQPAPAPAAGVRASIDPATGAVRTPTAEERAASAARKRAERAAALRSVQIVTHANGMRTAELGDAFLFDVVVETRPDGTIGYRCVPRSAAAPPAKETK